MTQPLPAPEAAARSQRIMWVLLALLIVLPLVAIAGVYAYRHYLSLWKQQEIEASADRDLADAIAETDRLDPRWRLEDIESDRAIVPDERNSALVAMEAARLMPERWPFWEFGVEQEGDDFGSGIHPLDSQFSDLELQRQLNPEMITALRTELGRAAAAIDHARKLADLPEGRYPITHPDDWFATPVPHLSGTRQIAHLLRYDAMLKAQEADTDGALESCLAILDAGRSFGDEPFLSSSLVRIPCETMAVGTAQRVLAQGQPSAALERLQQMFEKEEAEPVLLIALRGERADTDNLLSAVQSGRRQLSQRDREELGYSAGPTAIENLDVESPASIKSLRASVLREMNRAVEIARLPLVQQRKQFAQWAAAEKDQSPRLQRLGGIFATMSEISQRAKVWLRCAAVALAAERYRQAKGQWPDRLDALVTAGYLREAPVDLFDGKPLRVKRLDDGLVIYSVGPDEEDNGGNVNTRSPTLKGTDIGFRLWDPAQRRQPPAPPKPPQVNDLGPEEGR